MNFSKKSSIFLSAQWEYLAMFNYEVDPEILLPHLPPYTQIDCYNGMALVSVVGFLFNDTKVFKVRWPMHTNFEEINLRYYIKHTRQGQTRRGVGFISEIVPKPIIANIANVLYNEHYSTAKMNHKIQETDSQISLEFNWKRKKEEWGKMTIVANNHLENMVQGSEEDFIFQHYYGFNKLNEETTIEYSVNHPDWQIYQVLSYSLNCNIETLYGKEFVPFLKDKLPQSVFLARGSEVTVGKPKKIRK